MKSGVFALFGVFGAVRKCSSHARTIYAEVVEGEGEAQSWRLRREGHQMTAASCAGVKKPARKTLRLSYAPLELGPRGATC